MGHGVSAGLRLASEISKACRSVAKIPPLFLQCCGRAWSVCEASPRFLNMNLLSAAQKIMAGILSYLTSESE